MSYEPTEWGKGDVVTSAKLNKLEQGVANAGDTLVVPTFTSTSDTTGTCDMTFEQVLTAIEAGRCFIAKAIMNGFNMVLSLYAYSSELGHEHIQFTCPMIASDYIRCLVIEWVNGTIHLSDVVYTH